MPVLLNYFKMWGMYKRARVVKRLAQEACVSIAKVRADGLRHTGDMDRFFLRFA